jgi:hypothetical protein
MTVDFTILPLEQRVLLSGTSQHVATDHDLNAAYAQNAAQTEHLIAAKEPTFVAGSRLSNRKVRPSLVVALLTMDNTRIRVGEPINVTLTIVNHSRKTIEFSRSASPFDGGFFSNMFTVWQGSTSAKYYGALVEFEGISNDPRFFVRILPGHQASATLDLNTAYTSAPKLGQGGLGVGQWQLKYTGSLGIAGKPLHDLRGWQDLTAIPLITSKVSFSVFNNLDD